MYSCGKNGVTILFSHTLNIIYDLTWVVSSYKLLSNNLKNMLNTIFPGQVCLKVKWNDNKC